MDLTVYVVSCLIPGTGMFAVEVSRDETVGGLKALISRKYHGVNMFAPNKTVLVGAGRWKRQFLNKEVVPQDPNRQGELQDDEYVGSVIGDEEVVFLAVRRVDSENEFEGLPTLCTPRRQEPRPVGERGRTKTKTPWTQPQLEALVSFMETQYPKYKGGRADAEEQGRQGGRSEYVLFNWKGCQRQHPDLGWTQSSPTFIRDKWKALKLAWQASTDDPTVPSRLLTQCFCDVSLFRRVDKLMGDGAHFLVPSPSDVNDKKPALGAPEAGQARQEGEEAPGGAAGGAAAGGAVVAATEGGAPEEPPADGRSGKKGGSGKGKAKGAKAGGAEEAVGRVPRHDRATPVLSPNKDSAHLPSKRKAAGAAEAGEERSQDTDGGRVRKSKRLRERQPENPAEGGAEDDDSLPDTQIVADQVQPAKAQKRAAHTSRAKTNR